MVRVVTALRRLDETIAKTKLVASGGVAPAGRHAMGLARLQTTTLITHLGDAEATGHTDDVVVAVTSLPADPPLELFLFDGIHKEVASGVVA